MDAGADAADALHHKDHLIEILVADQAFQAAVHKTELGHGLHHGFVLHHEFDVQRLRQHRMLRPEGNDGGAVAHACSPLAASPPSGAGVGVLAPAGRFTVVMVK